MGVFLKKVMLHGPDMIESQRIGQAALLQRILIDAELRGPAERSRRGKLKENSEFDDIAP